MKILRDLRTSTKLLILSEITTDSYSKLKPIADKLAITIQGVSEYMKIMQAEGLVQTIGGEYKATTKGVQLLHDNIRQLKDFVDKTMERLDIIDVCTAIAKTPVKKGETVGLFMECGILTAYSKKKSKSTGIAMSDVAVGEDLGVTGLEGVVELSSGTLFIIELPTIRDGGSRKVALEKVRKKISAFKPDRIAALDITGLALIDKLGLKCDFEFAPINPAIEAVQKGLSVMAVGSTGSVHNLFSAIDEANAASEVKMKYELLSFNK